MKHNYPIFSANRWNPVPIPDPPVCDFPPERIDGRIVMPHAVKVGYGGLDKPEPVDQDPFTIKLRQAARNRGEIRMELNRGTANELDTP